MTFVFLDLGVFMMLLFPLLVFWYLLITNADMLERNLKEGEIDAIRVKGALSKRSRTALLIVASFFIALSLSRPVFIERPDGVLKLERDFALVLKKGEEQEAKRKIDTLFGEIALFVAEDELYMVSPPTLDKEFLKKRIDLLEEFEIKTGGQNSLDIHKKISELLKKQTTILTPNSKEVFEEESLEFAKVVELYKYPLKIGVLALFIALFMPKIGNIKITPLVLLILLFQPLEGGVFDDSPLKKAEDAYKNGQYQEAIDIYANYTKEENRVYYNIGNCYYKSGRFQKAIESYKKFQPDNPQEEFYKYYNLGNSFFEIADFENAEVFYKKAKKIEPTDKELLYNMSLLPKNKSTNLNKNGETNSAKKTEKNKKRGLVIVR